MTASVLVLFASLFGFVVCQTTTVAPAATTAAPGGLAPDSGYDEYQKFGISCATFACLAVAWGLFCFMYAKISDKCFPDTSPKYAQVPQANKI